MRTEQEAKQMISLAYEHLEFVVDEDARKQYRQYIWGMEAIVDD